MSRFRSGIRNTNTSPDAEAARIAAEQWGVVDNGELWECGMSRGMVMRRRQNGLLHEIYPGVYSLGHNGLPLKGQFLAATKACGRGAALSHISAGVLWDLLAWDEDRLPEVTVATGHTRRIPGILVHRTRVPFKTLRFDAIPVTSPARTLADLSSVLPFKPLRRAVREAMALKRTTMKELLAEPHRRAALNEILADGYTPTRTELEDAVLDLITDAGFTKPEINQRQTVDGRPTTPDFHWPDQRLVVEADSKEWHDHPLARQDDAERQARLEASGHRVIRVTWAQALTNPQQTIARLRAAGAPTHVPST